MVLLAEANSRLLEDLLEVRARPCEHCRLFPDGQRMVAGSSVQGAKLWDLASGREPLMLPDVYAVAFSPDGQRIVTGTQYGAEIRETASGKRLLTLNFGNGPMQSVAFSPDGQRIVACRILGEPGCRMRPAVGNCIRSPVFGSWPFPRMASESSPGVTLGLPGCGTRPVARNCSPSIMETIKVLVWPFPRMEGGL